MNFYERRRHEGMLNMRGVDRAINKAGGRVELAKAMQVTRQAVHNWVMRGFVPPDKALRIEECYGIPAVDLVSERTRKLLDSLRRSQ